MMHPHLLQTCPLATRLGLDLGVDQGSRRGERQPAQEVAAKEFEGAVDIPQVDAEQHPHRNIEHLGQHTPVQRIAALHAKTGDDVVLANEGREQAQIADVELAICVHEHDEVAGRSRKSRDQCRPITPVAPVAYQPNAIVTGRQTSDDLAGAVTTPIIDHDDLVRIDICGKRRQRVLDDRVDIGLFVERGKDESKAAGKSRYRRARGIRVPHPTTASSAGGTHSSTGAAASDSGTATSAPGYQPIESTPAGGNGGSLASRSIGAWPFMSGLTFQTS